jgi:hypothetical protein
VAEGREAAEGARLVTHASCGGCGFFYSRDGLGTKTSGHPDASDARTEAFPFFLKVFSCPYLKLVMAGFV